jgi:pilus assembly protein CpaD
MARITITATLITSILVVGCAQSNPELAAKHNPSVYSIHQPVVQRTDYAIDLELAGNGLSASEASRLGGWFKSLQIGYGDRIFIDEQNGYGDDAIRKDVAQIISAYGLSVSDEAPVTAGNVQPGMVRIIVSRTKASVAGCPDWSYAKLPGAPISTDSNYGCAVNTNLAAMIANPNDLVLGQSGVGVSDAATASKAIKQYRDAALTGAAGLKKSEKTTGGNK